MKEKLQSQEENYQNDVIAKRNVLTIPGKFVSVKQLVRMGSNRQLRGKETLKIFLDRLIQELANENLGTVHRFSAANCREVYFFEKYQPLPRINTALQSYGLNYDEYVELFNTTTLESKAHENCFNSVNRRRFMGN
ncbi:uncharacterized protein [Clytia hemisphaerica]|uniref:uncharacterized protein n=1 Tax=Clytia hemisphaerica TaxID=252671 RepID=UPI0034D550A7